MSNAKCRAKDPSKCPYHGAVLRMEEANEKILVYVHKKEPIPSELFEAFAQAKAELDTKIAEGWDEDAYAQLWKPASTTDNEPEQSDRTVAETSPSSNKVDSPVKVEDVPDSSANVSVRTALPKVSTVIEGEKVIFERGDLYDLDRIPKYVRLQFHAPLNPKKKAQFASLIQYSLKVAFKSVNATFEAPKSDSGYSFIIPVEALKEKKNVRESLTNFGRMMKVFVKEGTPKRPSRNDTRRYEKIPGEDSFKFKLYFSSYAD